MFVHKIQRSVEIVLSNTVPRAVDEIALIFTGAEIGIGTDDLRSAQVKEQVIQGPLCNGGFRLLQVVQFVLQPKFFIPDVFECQMPVAQGMSTVEVAAADGDVRLIHLTIRMQRIGESAVSGLLFQTFGQFFLGFCVFVLPADLFRQLVVVPEVFDDPLIGSPLAGNMDGFHQKKVTVATRIPNSEIHQLTKRE